MGRPEFPRLDHRLARTVPLPSRPSKVVRDALAGPPRPGSTFREFFGRLPRILAAEELRAAVRAIRQARDSGRPVIWGLGAHVVKVGLNPVIIALMDAGYVSGIAMNGAGAIHDFELALVGQTSEDVAEGLATGTFGMAEETGRYLNECAAEAMAAGAGWGEMVGRKVLELNAPNADISLFAQAYRRGIPATLHVTVGADIIHMHPSARGDALGAASFEDFLRFAGLVARLEGGVYLNVGSAVVLPEVFLKALNLARNLGHRVENFTTVNLDMVRHYRPSENVLRRPTLQGGRGIHITGHHELMVPLLAQALIDGLE